MTAFPVLDVPGTSSTFADRVFSYIDFSGDCWQWTGSTSHGYGTIGRGARGSGNEAAHRAVWMLLVGLIAPGMQYDHLCRNHVCVNPDHGEIVTPAVNKARGFSPAALHAKRDACAAGHPKDGRTRGHRYCKTCSRAKGRRNRQPKGPKTECLHGHLYTAGNTYTDKRGHRQCKACKADRQRASRAAMAVAA